MNLTASLLVTCVMVTPMLAGCTGDDGDDKGGGEGPGGGPADVVALNAAVGTVTGRLDPARGEEITDAVGGVVDAWFEAAYLEGDYPRTDFAGAFPGFTPGAAARAVADAAFLTNADIGGQIDDVEVVRRDVTVDLLSPKQQPAGATARFELEFDTSGALAQRVLVSGRLMLAPDASGAWQIFGYDVAKTATPSATPSEGSGS